MKIELVTHIFGIALALLPFGFVVTILTRNGAWFAGAIIIDVEVITFTLLLTIYTRMKRK